MPHLNSRVTPEYDNYTFVSTRGCSVPDYFFCPTENLFNCTEMKTILVSDVINNLGLEPPISIPDHSILSATFRMSFYEVGINYENMNVVKNDQNKYKTENSKALPQKSLKKNLSKINEQFFMSQEILQQVLNTISKLENIVDTKDELNKLWAEVKNIFLGEMSTLPTIPSSKLKKQNKKFRKSQPFWNSELEIMWKNSCSCEKAYLDFRVHSNQDFAIKNILRLNFKTAQKNFDKKFRYLKRQHHKNQFRDLETNASKNPTAMWEALKKLDNRPTTKAALEIIREDKSVSTDLKEVLERWYRDISGLFSGLQEDPELAFNEEFFQNILKKKSEFEEMPFEEQKDNSIFNTDEMNSEISYDEVSDAINSSKFKKAYLEIPNEVLKNKNAKLLLHKFFNLCFSSGFNPSDWDYSDIVPLPKKDKDPRDPLQNRCITIVCCIAKIYSNI